MPPDLSGTDVGVLVVYLVVTVGFGCWFVRKSRGTEAFMAAGRSLPGWVVGLSILGTYVSSISFLANPGKAYGGNWNPFVFGLSLPLAAWIATRWFVPFYRSQSAISAYDHLERRFGTWARVYAVFCYLATQLVRIGAIMYLVALALAPLTGWDMRVIMVVTGVLVTVYTLLGGIEAVIWTDVIQSVVLLAGMLVCLIVLLAGMPGGPVNVFRIGMQNGKFSLGSLGWSIGQPTFWVVFVYGLVINLQNFGIDQSYVQRYATARDTRSAVRSVWLGALLYLPISAALFLIGTALFAFYSSQPDLLATPMGPISEADKVFPHFIVTQLPTGVTGLLIAAIMAAAMSSVDSSLNCSATLILCDIYRRFIRPGATERQSMIVLYASTLCCGLAGTAIAVSLVGIPSALDAWWHLSGIFSGGMLGLFLLGLISRRAGNPAAVTGVLTGILCIAWMTFSPTWGELPGAVSVSRGSSLMTGTDTTFLDTLQPGDRIIVANESLQVDRVTSNTHVQLTLPWSSSSVDQQPFSEDSLGYRLRSPFHSFLITVVATLAILLVGVAASRMFRSHHPS